MKSQQILEIPCKVAKNFKDYYFQLHQNCWYEKYETPRNLAVVRIAS